MIECRDITCKAGKKRLLENVNITVQDGSITVLVGNNGSGKTTLVRAITAYHERRRDISGTINVDGDYCDTLTPRAISRRIALLPQTLPISKITVRELVSLARASMHSPFSRLSEEERIIVNEAIADTRLTALADCPVERLSGGERQSAYLAMLLAKDAPNILLDEPTSALDSRARTRLFDFLLRMRKQGRAILAVLHDLTDATEIADRIVALDSGRVVFDGTPDELKRSDIPMALFGVIPCEAERDGKKITVYLPQG